MAGIGPPSVEAVGRLRPALGRVTVAIGFWGAVVLGVATLPVLLTVPARIDVLVLLVGGDVVCLLVGHRYEPAAEGWLTGWVDRESEVSG